MYVGPFVATWEKIVDIRSILREGAFMFGKKIAILLSTAMILTGSCVSSVAVHAQTGYAAEYAPVVLQWKPADTGKRGG